MWRDPVRSANHKNVDRQLNGTTGERKRSHHSSFFHWSNCLQIVTSALWECGRSLDKKPRDLQILHILFRLKRIGVSLKYSFGLITELYTSQSVAAQSVHARPERGHRKVLLVDAESGGQARKIGAAPCRLHGDVPVREAPWQSQEAGRGVATGRSCWPKRCHALAEQQCQRGAGPFSREPAAQVTINFYYFPAF